MISERLGAEKMAEPREFMIKTGKEGFYDITAQVTKAVRESGVEEGVALIFCPHTTASVTITENTDPNVGRDMLLSTGRAFPDYKDFRHSEGNSFAHVKSSVMGCEMQIIVTGGWPLFGPWQAIYFVEFDGPRERRYYVKVIEC